MRSLVLAVLVTLGCAAPASAADLIEGSWFFSDGEVLVEATGAGTYKGTVVKPTQFSECTHQAGEEMWDIRATADPNVFEGGHNWFNTPACTIIETKGRSRWTIISSDPANFVLRFCSISPRNDTGQPLTDDNCQDLRRLRPPAPKPTPANTFVLPSQGKKKCLSKRNFRIRLKQPAADPLVSATVNVNGKLVRTIKQNRITAPIDLRGLPKGRYSVKISALTTTGRTIQTTRRYRTCVPKKKR